MIQLKKFSESSYTEEERIGNIADSIPQKSPLRGPNGNVLIHIEWRKRPGEKFSSYEGGLVSTMVSDWDNAEECEYCGREIVHVYYVYDKDSDEIKAYGKSHAHLALGYNKPLTSRKLSDIEAAINRFNTQKEGYKEEFKMSLSGTWEGIRYSVIHRGLNLRDMAQNGLKLFWNKDEKKGIAYPWNWLHEAEFYAALYDLELEEYNLGSLSELRDFLEK